jgi:hypothetical protein
MKNNLLGCTCNIRYTGDSANSPCAFIKWSIRAVFVGSDSNGRRELSLLLCGPDGRVVETAAHFVHNISAPIYTSR